MKSWFSKPLDNSNQNLFSCPWSHYNFLYFPLGFLNKKITRKAKAQNPKPSLISVAVILFLKSSILQEVQKIISSTLLIYPRKRNNFYEKIELG